jgi:sugar phosphate isomerase/epimerase
MRLACGDHSFPLLPHEQVCRLAAALGLQGIDIGLMGNRSHIRPELIREDVAGWADRVGRSVADAGIEVADVFLIPWTDFETMAPNHPDAAQREEAAAIFRLALDFTERLGATGMTLLPGIDWPDEDHETGLRRSAQELAWRVAEGRERGIRVSVEPHLGSNVADPAEAARLVELTPGLELTLDYGHFTYQGVPDAEIEPLIAHARHFHARGAAPQRMQIGLKDNTIDYERIVEAMREQDYDGWLAVEYVWSDWERCDECDNVSETVLLRDRLQAAIDGRPWDYPSGLAQAAGAVVAA